ncbi:MAG: dihydrodipicolinate synthase family protein [Acidobacteria bacterium]|nr:dihydrodipicolinate synthase family protein [Acidobacteriota bacterium]
MTRRELLALAAGPLVFAEPRGRLRGIFPIAQTPFNEAGKLDLEALAAEVRFVHRCGAHGFVWPQMASEYSLLTEAERMAGNEAIAASAKGLKPAVVIGVQAPEVATACRYAKQAEKLGADAVIALPPHDSKDRGAVFEYYKAIGAASGLPLFIQAVGDMPVPFILEMAAKIPTLRCVKDEAGATPLPRIAGLREKLLVFTGGHGVTLIDEMLRGSSGSMPAASFVDLYARAWDAWQAGERARAVDLCSKAIVFVPEVQVFGIQALKYVLFLRGVFPAYGVRAKDARAPLDDSAKQTLRLMYETLKPHLAL